MTSPSRPHDRAVIGAASDLRAAVHALAAASVGGSPDVASLERAAALVRSATAELSSEQSSRTWEGPHETAGMGGYRRRSLFQGEFHPFASTVRWESCSGPAGQEGLGFRVTLSRLFEGPPDAAHGGYLAGLFDELLGGVQGRTVGGGGYTAKLDVRYRSPTPLDQELAFRGWIEQEKGRRIHVAATCTAAETLCADARGLFVRPPRARQAS